MPGPGILKDAKAPPRPGERPPVTISTSVTLSTHTDGDTGGSNRVPSTTSKVVSRLYRMYRGPFKGCRERTLKCINCRPFLIAICALVVIECACVLAELMVDLQGIKYRFENEESEIQKLVTRLREKFPGAFESGQQMRDINDVINTLQEALHVRDRCDLTYTNRCPCSCDGGTFAQSAHAKAQVFVNPDDTMSFTNRKLQWVDTFNEGNDLDSLLPSAQGVHGTNSESFIKDHVPSSSTIQTTEFASTGRPNLEKETSLLQQIKELDQNKQRPSEKLLTRSQSIFTTLLTQGKQLGRILDVSPTNSSQRLFRKEEWALPVIQLIQDAVQEVGKHRKALGRRLLSIDSQVLKSSVGIVESLQKLGDKRPQSIELQSKKKSDFSQTSVKRIDKKSDGNVEHSYSLETGSSFDENLDKTSFSSYLHQDLFNLNTADLNTRSPSTKSFDSSNQFPFTTFKSSNKFIKSLDEPNTKSSNENTNFVNFKPFLHHAFLDSSTEPSSMNEPTSKHFAIHNSEPRIIDSYNSAPDPSTLHDEFTALSQAYENLRKYSPYFDYKNKLSPNSNAQLTPIPNNAINQGSFTPNSNPSFYHEFEPLQQIRHERLPRSVSNTNCSHNQTSEVSLDNILVMEIKNKIESFYLVVEVLPKHISYNDKGALKYNEEYSRIYKTSKGLHFISLSILSVMVLETAIKLFCTGCAFFKKKFEVFDAFIVVSSFALDFVFLDSRWYETGKDATTILVLLLPWRVVRIVNSFLMTMKHKHHLQMMNMKRAKKKAELKAAKLQTLLSEVRKDVQLLVALCRGNEIEEKDIVACLYGKGRRSVTLSAMSTCTSLMLISTLGKDAMQEDDIYGKVFKEALNEGDLAEVDTETTQAEEAAIDAAIQLDEQIEARRKSKKYKSKKARVKRSYTVPRRSASVEIPEPDINENNSNIFYVNDGYLTAKGRGSTSLAGDVIMVAAEDFASATSSGGASSSSGACEIVPEEGEDTETFQAVAKKGAAPVPAARQYHKASVRSLPRKGSNSMVIYLPEFEDEFEIKVPIKKQRQKKKSSVRFDNKNV